MKAKATYLTAIEHYTNETVSGIQSFCNQVYIFLALIDLGVDLTDTKHPDMYTSPDDTEAKKYLDFFEGSCWDIATCWSKMHFNLAKGEFYRKRNSNASALEFFKSGLKIALEGDFKAHIEFTMKRIELLEANQTPNAANRIKNTSVNELLRQIPDFSP